MLLTMAIGAGVLFTSYQVMFGEEDRLIKEVNQVLGDKGYVKSYDRKQKVYIIGLNVGSSFNDLEKLKGAFENLFKNWSERVILTMRRAYLSRLQDLLKELLMRQIGVESN